MKSRIIIVFITFIILWSALIVRATFLQVVPDQRLESLKKKQFETTITLSSRRGAIVDRNGRDLALSMSAYSLYADPKIIEQKKKLAKNLGQILNQNPQVIYEKIRNNKRRFVWIERFIAPDTAEKIRALDLRGLKLVQEFRRVYPNEALMAPVLGFVGREGQGLEGVELKYNDFLGASKKKVAVRRDARGRPLVIDGMMFTENPDGAEIKLTIDSEIQFLLEKELHRALIDYDASAAQGLVLDAKTSAIVAMVSAPSFDANRGISLPPEFRRNRVVTDAFEPGSTMKTFLVAGALKEKLLAPNTRYNTEDGRFQIGGRVIRESDSKHKWESLSVSEILAVSSNIGTSKIALEMGPEVLRKSLLDFGFGEKHGVDLPGEAKGKILPLPWHPHLLANVSFGHAMTATALQVANAYAAIANGGVLRKPYIVSSIRDPETGEEKEFGPQDMRRVLTTEEAAQMRMMLAGVTAPGGTGEKAKVDGFQVGGKTGTAQKVNPNGRGYIPGGYISSFAGMLPLSDPKYVIYVVIDHPKKKNSYYGSQIAAPIFSKVASYAVRKAGLSPVLLSEKNFSQPEFLKNKKVAEKNMAKKIMGAPQSPPATAAELAQVVPNWEGLTLREVLNRARASQISVQLVGSGNDFEMAPAPGEPLGDDRSLQIILK